MGADEELGGPVLAEAGAEVGVTVGWSGSPAFLPSGVVGEALALKDDDGTTVAAAPVGKNVIHAKSRSPRLGLEVGAEDPGPPPPKPVSSVIVGEELADKTSDGETVAPVGE